MYSAEVEIRIVVLLPLKQARDDGETCHMETSKSCVPLGNLKVYVYFVHDVNGYVTQLDNLVMTITDVVGEAIPRTHGKPFGE
jgi:hypothetical protein